MVTLIDGPCDRMVVPVDWVGGDEVLMTVETADPPDVRFVRSDAVVPPVKSTKRLAVYRLDNEEDGVARFAFWNDERPSSPLSEAMANASDDAILNLMEQMPRRNRR